MSQSRPSFWPRRRPSRNHLLINSGSRRSCRDASGTVSSFTLVAQRYYQGPTDVVRWMVGTHDREGSQIDAPVAAGKTWRDTTGRGDTAEFAVLLALARDGRRVLRPMSSATRYDLVLDNEDGTFTRIQCKCGTLRSGCIEFRVYSVSGHSTKGKGYSGEVDAFGVYCPQTGDAYLVPMAAVSGCGTLAALGLEPAKNGQRRRTRSAAPFRIGRSRRVLPDLG